MRDKDITRELCNRFYCDYVRTHDGVNLEYLRENHVPMSVISGATKTRADVHRHCLSDVRRRNSLNCISARWVTGTTLGVTHVSRRVASIRASAAIQHNVKRRTTPRRRCHFKCVYIQSVLYTRSPDVALTAFSPAIDSETIFLADEDLSATFITPLG